MCLSIPGKIVEIGEDRFVVDYGSEKREAVMSVVEVKTGDYVIVSNKIIINIVPENQAVDYLEIIKKNARKENEREL